MHSLSCDSFMTGSATFQLFLGQHLKNFICIFSSSEEVPFRKKTNHEQQRYDVYAFTFSLIKFAVKFNDSSRGSYNCSNFL